MAVGKFPPSSFAVAERMGKGKKEGKEKRVIRISPFIFFFFQVCRTEEEEEEEEERENPPIPHHQRRRQAKIASPGKKEEDRSGDERDMKRLQPGRRRRKRIRGGRGKVFSFHQLGRNKKEKGRRQHPRP